MYDDTCGTTNKIQHAIRKEIVGLCPVCLMVYCFIPDALQIWWLVMTYIYNILSSTLVDQYPGLWSSV